MLTYTPVLSLVLQISAVEAADARYEFIQPEHLFIGLCKLESFANTNRLRALGVPESQIGILAAEIDLLMGLFGRFDINTATFRHELRRQKGIGSFKPASDNKDRLIHRSPESRQAFDLAGQIAQRSASPLVAIFHLLAGLLQDTQSNLTGWLQSKTVDVVGLRRAAEITVLPLQTSDARGATAPVHKAESLSAQCSKDLTRLAYQNQIQFVPRYQDAALNILRTLNRPGGNNPLLLVEDAGISEEIVRNVAWLIANGKAPSGLKKRRIIQMDLDGLSENISYQGEFSERVRDFIQEARGEEDVILFVSDIDVMIGSGSLHADMDNTARSLQDALMRRQLQCIGAAGQTEFQEYIGQNSDWRKLFTPVSISVESSDDGVAETTIPVEQLGPIRIADPFQQPEEMGERGSRHFKQTRPQPEVKQQSGREEQTALDALLDNLQMRLTRFGVRVHYTPDIMTFLKRLERTSLSLEREFARRVEDPLGGMLLRGEVDYGQAVVVDVVANELVLQVSEDGYD